MQQQRLSNNSSQLNMFRAVNFAHLQEHWTVCYSLRYNARTMLPARGQQHRRCIIPQTVTHNLVLLKMGKIISRNMLS